MCALGVATPSMSRIELERGKKSKKKKKSTMILKERGKAA